MKLIKHTFFFLLICAIAWPAVGQKKDYFVKKGFAVAGYDVVSYFDGEPLQGDKSIVATYDGVQYAFAKAENKEKFLAAPASYLPQYGGYCAYAIAAKGIKYKVDPETYEIRDGKLYLFYNNWGNNTLEKWLKENPEALQAKADSLWPSLQHVN